MRFFNAKWSTLVAQFTQYVIVGGIAFAIDFSLMVGLIERLGIDYLIAATLSFLVGLMVNYTLCVCLVFEERSLKSRTHEFAVFSLVGIAGLGLNASIMGFMVGVIDFRYTEAKLVAAAFILLFNFTLRRQLLFSAKSPLTKWIETLSARVVSWKQS
ncbi:MAG: GtrA family protein [Pseudomonadota bacterium]